MFSDEIIKLVWDNAKIVDGMDPDFRRLDPCGAWIEFAQYSQEGEYGWVIDHVYPLSKIDLDIFNPNELINLRAMHWRNNRVKGDSYPDYQAACKANGNVNINELGIYTVNSELRAALEILYKVK